MDRVQNSRRQGTAEPGTQPKGEPWAHQQLPREAATHTSFQDSDATPPAPAVQPWTGHSVALCPASPHVKRQGPLVHVAFVTVNEIRNVTEPVHISSSPSVRAAAALLTGAHSQRQGCPRVEQGAAWARPPPPPPPPERLHLVSIGGCV